MFRKSFLTFLAILFLGGINAEAYFFSATDGSNLYLFRAEVGSNGRLGVTSEFKYAAPGSIGSTALLPAPGTTDTKKVFDLFGTYNSSGKPVLFRDRVEFDEASGTWKFVSRELFPSHKLDSFNTFSAASPNANQRYLLTENGPNVNRRKVNSSGKPTGGNKPIFKNSSSVDPLSAAISPDGRFAVESSFGNSVFGFHIRNVLTKQQANYTVGGYIMNTSVAHDSSAASAGNQSANAKCVDVVFKEGEKQSGASVDGLAAADKTGVFYLTFDANSLQPGQVVTISKMSKTTLFQHEIFNTALLLPDGKGIVYAKHKKGKLEYRVQPLNAPCGGKMGASYTFLSINTSTIKNNNPLYGWGAALCTYPGLC